MSVVTHRLIFSLNCFAASMLALYIALSLDLMNPFWSMMTVYIVSSPQAGSVRSKALYRLLGTIAGGAASVIMVPALGNAPEMLSLALALWVGLCLGVALLDRTPRSYVFMLGGYTAALIGFTTVNNPLVIFDVALARVEEIGLGIVCATAFHSIIYPQGARVSLTTRITAFMRDAQTWTLDALAGQHVANPPHAHKLSADVTELYIMATHLPFDTSDLQTKSREVSKLSERMAMLLPLAATVGDRLNMLRQDPRPLPPETEALLADVTVWVGLGLDARVEDAADLLARAKALEPTIPADPDMHEMMAASFHARLVELIIIYRDCRMLSRHLTFGTALPPEGRTLAAETQRQSLHLDYGMAIWSGLAATAAILLICAFWILTGWADGGTAAMMTAIFMCFFASMDDPAKAISGFTLYTALGIPIAAIYLFAIMQPLDSFPMLALALSPFLIGCGYLAAIPAYAPRVIPVILGVTGALAIQETFAPDFARFANSSIAMVAGCFAAGVITRLIRSVGADFGARRIIHAAWRDLARASTTRKPPDRSEWITRMVDRLGLLGPRLGALPDRDAVLSGAVVDLRTGLNILSLRALRSSGMGGPALDAVLEQLNRHFRRKASGREDVPSPEVMSRIDAAIDDASRQPASPLRHEALLALAGLRRLLFPQSITIERAGA
ncbi:FUSC family protein [Sphingomonas sp. C3-2]|uniref:FUSC family protein n=1 Tax=Sphingomonas sp. C3-2 TaxID=3062169 RepID=UPI00294B782B|nr:FUSC family protein [Sphingomonas sp. C3-2]WOK36537.1 FUSC family protein [Sphingomonas sp. C3-2]